MTRISINERMTNNKKRQEFLPFFFSIIRYSCSHTQLSVLASLAGYTTHYSGGGPLASQSATALRAILMPPPPKPSGKQK